MTAATCRVVHGAPRTNPQDCIDSLLASIKTLCMENVPLTQAHYAGAYQREAVENRGRMAHRVRCQRSGENGSQISFFASQLSGGLLSSPSRAADGPGKVGRSWSFVHSCYTAGRSGVILAVWIWFVSSRRPCFLNVHLPYWLVSSCALLSIQMSCIALGQHQRFLFFLQQTYVGVESCSPNDFQNRALHTTFKSSERRSCVQRQVLRLQEIKVMDGAAREAGIKV